jgi:1-acyl-sn-glycerol-3-phosphate acyltransferase
MIELFRRQFRRIRRLYRFAGVVLRSHAEARRLQRSDLAPPSSRVQVLQGWCRRSLNAIDIKVEVEGMPPTYGLLVSNHLSYLDIAVYSSVTPCAFVSKAEVAHWAIFGPFTRQAGTIFVQRGNQASSHSATQQIAENLRAGIAVVLFPEGTTTDGANVLRFHSTMLQSAIDAGVTVTPCALSYTVSGGSEKEVAWWGAMTLPQHIWKLLGLRQVIARVSFGEALAADIDRRALSDCAREKVVALREELLRGAESPALQR